MDEEPRRRAEDVLAKVERDVQPVLNGVDKHARATFLMMISAIPVMLVLIGIIYGTGKAVGDIGNKLDRNCRVLVEINADVEYLIISRVKDNPAFHHVFKNKAMEACG